ncbi:MULTISPECIES: phage tail assembly chaperone [unclassified Pseudomonas]|uniref:phage tail assembly chaperone n=1 Tax=unclassified Pseudomonas TaxID=196821 RepID=UPI000A1F8434|nr:MULTISPECIES: phage tail assembly chaperone [unclassified Pseudomonas]
MAKSKFLLVPKPTFSSAVMLPAVGGEPVKVNFEFRYRDRTELASLYAEWGERHKALGEKIEETGLEQFTAMMIDLQVEQLQAIVVGWDIAETFNEENLRVLVRSLTAAPSVVLAAYSEAFQNARLGNS